MSKTKTYSFDLDTNETFTLDFTDLPRKPILTTICFGWDNASHTDATLIYYILYGTDNSMRCQIGATITIASPNSDNDMYIHNHGGFIRKLQIVYSKGSNTAGTGIIHVIYKEA